VTPLYQLYPERAWLNNIAWVVAAALLLLAIPFARLGDRRWAIGMLRRLTVPALAAVAVVAMVYAAISGATENGIRDAFPAIFAVLAAAQAVLGALFAAYEASLPGNEAALVKSALLIAALLARALTDR
jgi:hydrogenase/urease accessory protein HupE